MSSLTIPKRARRRSRVFVFAQVSCEGGSMDARIRDISSSGALIEADVSPRLDAIVELACGKTRLRARVVWVDGFRFGVEFSRPLLMNSLVDRSGARLAVSAPRNYQAANFSV